MGKKSKPQNIESIVVSTNSTGAAVKHLNYTIEDILKNKDNKEIQELLKRIKQIQKQKQELNIGEVERIAYKLARGFYVNETKSLERFHPKTGDIVTITETHRKYIKPELGAITLLLKAYLPEIYGMQDTDDDYKFIDIDFKIDKNLFVELKDES